MIFLNTENNCKLLQISGLNFQTTIFLQIFSYFFIIKFHYIIYHIDILEVSQKKCIINNESVLI